MKLVFGDEAQSVRELLQRSFRAERQVLHHRLGNVYTMHFGHVGLDGHNNAVLILDAYTDLHPKHPLRLDWCRCVETAYESNTWDKVPFLVYYLGSSCGNDDIQEGSTACSPKLALIPQASFVPYQRKMTDYELIPSYIQQKVLVNTPLSTEERAIWNACREQIKAQEAGTSWRPSFVISHPEESIVEELLATANIQTSEPLWNERLYVYLPQHKAYYEGKVAEVRENALFHKVLYDDGHEDWLDLSEETYKLLGTNTPDLFSRIAVHWGGDNAYYGGTVVDVCSDATFYRIKFKDGDEAWLPQNFKYSLMPSTKSTTSANEKPSNLGSLEERTLEDGSVLPKVKPRKDRNGLYVRPKGRAVLGCVWNSRTGVWVRDCCDDSVRLQKRAQSDQDPRVPRKVLRISHTSSERKIEHEELSNALVASSTKIYASLSSERNTGSSNKKAVPASSQCPKHSSKAISRQHFRELQQYLPLQDDVSAEKLDCVKNILLALIDCDITYAEEDKKLYHALKDVSKKPNLSDELKDLSRQLFQKIRMAFNLEKWKTSMESQDFTAFNDSTENFRKQVKATAKKPLVLTKGIIQSYGIADLVQTTKCFCTRHQIATPDVVAVLEKLVQT